jgi:hypothetical protein
VPTRVITPSAGFNLGNAEVSDLDRFLIGRKQQILRLNVAMNDP